MTIVKAEVRPGTPLAVRRQTVTRAQLSNAVRDGCGAAWIAVKAQGGRGGRNVAVYVDGSIRVESGVQLNGPFTDTGDVVTSSTPTGFVAFATHAGPYQTLGATHDAVRSWCEANGHALAGPNWEIYGHWLPEWNNDPSKITTEVCYLIAR